MAEDIEIRVSVDGAEQASRGVEGVADALDHERRSADGARAATGAAETSMVSMGQRGQQLAQRVQGVAGAVQQLISATGSTSRAGSLVASVAASTAQFAAMGAMLGPAGAVVGGLIGLTAGLIGAADASRTAAASADRAAESFAAMGRAAREARMERDRATDISVGDIGADRSDADLRDEAEGRRTTIRRAEEALATARSARDGAEMARIMATLPQLRQDVENISDELDRRAALPVGVDAPEASFTAPAARGGRGGGAGAPAATDFYADITGESGDDAATRINAELSEAEDRHAEYVARIEEQERGKQDYLIELAAEEAERDKEALDARIQAEEEKNAAILEMNTDRLEREEAAEEEARQRQVEAQTEFMQLGMNVVGLMTDALGAIASGEKTAEDAFKGLAKAFLSMISQYAMLKAATEFAEAIGAFASFNYGGGALHLAAGIAFTAVAVATGVGAAAINVSRPTAPARPEADRGDAGGKGRGGDTIINWNSPVITASTRDDLGRELGAMVRAGEARYGGA